MRRYSASGPSGAHLADGVGSYAASVVENPVDSRLAEAGLLGDLPDPKWVTQTGLFEGFLMVFCA